MGRFFQVARGLCTLLGLSILAVTFTPVVYWLLRPMTVDWYDGDADVLVVLGGSMLSDGTGPHAALGGDTYLRCVYASWYIQTHRYRYVAVSGGDGLAEAMAHYLEGHGARPEQLVLENGARSTSENAIFMKRILDHIPGLSAHPVIAVLTSDYHSRRARLVFEHLGMPVRAIPVPDAAKRASFFALRWNAFQDVAGELVKTGVYRLEGKI